MEHMRNSDGTVLGTVNRGPIDTANVTGYEHNEPAISVMYKSHDGSSMTTQLVLSLAAATTLRDQLTKTLKTVTFCCTGCGDFDEGKPFANLKVDNGYAPYCHECWAKGNWTPE